MWAGVDIGGTKTAVVLSSCLPTVESRREFPTLPAQGPARVLDLIRANLYGLLSERGRRAHDLLGIGVSCGGPLDPVRGTISAPPNLSTWVDVPITSILANEFGAGCHLENDANACALAEHQFGAGRGTKNLVFVTMGTGLGAGLILNGQLYRGTSNDAGEIGHVRLTSSGPVGHNKSGSAEGWASGGGLAQLAARRLSEAEANGTPTILSHSSEAGPITAQEVWRAAQQGDHLAMQLITNAGQKLGQALAIMVDLLNPQRIIVGGLALRMGNALLDPAREVVKNEALPSSAAACMIVPAGLGEKIGDVASLCIAVTNGRV